MGGGFDADLGALDLERCCQFFFHKPLVGREFWGFCEEGAVDIDDGVAEVTDFSPSFFENFLGVEVFECRIGVGEEVADVGKAGGAEKGVGDGVGKAVGIGVAEEAFVVGDKDAAEDEVSARGEGVDIVAEADSKGRHGVF